LFKQCSWGINVQVVNAVLENPEAIEEAPEPLIALVAAPPGLLVAVRYASAFVTPAPTNACQPHTRFAQRFTEKSRTRTNRRSISVDSRPHSIAAGLLRAVSQSIAKSGIVTEASDIAGCTSKLRLRNCNLIGDACLLLEEISIEKK
jgi:hypothetical protein